MCVVKKHVRHNQYKEALFKVKVFHHGMEVLRSCGQQVCGGHVNKISLSSLDAKRWVAADGISTLAYGHRKAG